MSKPRLSISFSGGRTSAYMTWRLLNNERIRDRFDVRVLFANTGQEHEKTLEFVDRCDREFGCGVVWLEAVVHEGVGQGTRHRVVDFETASRDGEPFEDVIAKYGLPGPGYLHCTRELKANVMRSYERSIDWQSGEYWRAIGIRADEMDRVNPRHREERIWYPLLDWAVTKEEVTTFWSRQAFDLDIPEHLGNCVWCWKKSLRKHLTLATDEPWVFDFPARMERKYANAGSGDQPRKMFRGRRTTDDIFTEARGHFIPFVEGDQQRQLSILSELDEAGGCAEACEPFGPEDSAA